MNGRAVYGIGATRSRPDIVAVFGLMITSRTSPRWIWSSWFPSLALCISPQKISGWEIYTGVRWIYSLHICSRKRSSFVVFALIPTFSEGLALFSRKSAMSRKTRFEVLEHINYSSDIRNDEYIAYHNVDLDQILPLFSIRSI